jgi:hypothetical protein
MRENSVVERWNVMNVAEMAVSVSSVLYRVINNRPMPFDFSESVEAGIEFLTEAADGGKIVCGVKPSSGFTGTLSPLNWATPICLDFVGGANKKADVYKSITTLLTGYKEVLKKIEKNERYQDTDKAKEVHKFFRLLADILIQRVDPVSESYTICEP